MNVHAGRDFGRLRHEMVETAIFGRGVRSELVLNAMRKVRREAFLPKSLREFAYEDTPLPIEGGQTISQPYIVAFMIEALGLEGGERVLEIGAGSGYAAAVLSEIAGEIYTVERRIGQLAEKAASTLHDLGYDRDGQYLHYLTKWMHALCRAAVISGHPAHAEQAVELGAAAFQRFAHRSASGNVVVGIYWKMSTDLSRPLTLAMGQHHALDDLVSFREVQHVISKMGDKTGASDLTAAITSISSLCRDKGCPVVPELAGRLDGVAIRVPTPNVSVIDFKFVAKRATSKDEVNGAVKRAADQQLKGILDYTEAPNVSSDFNHDPHSSVFHMDQTRVIDGTLVRVMSWYDNEWGFSNRMVDTTVAMGKLG